MLLRHAALAALLALSVAAPRAAQAASLPFTGTLSIVIGTLPAIPIAGSGTATITASGLQLNSLALGGGEFATSGLLVPVTDPAAAPVQGVVITAANGAGSFAIPGGGAMPILGAAKVCLFDVCTGSPLANLVVPLTVVGNGGVATAMGAVNVTVTGAPWTTGTAAAGIFTHMGFHYGPVESGPSTTAQASGTVQLVTPILISTNIGSLALIPAFGVLNLHFVPEPGTLLMLGSGVLGLALLGRRRLR